MAASSVSELFELLSLPASSPARFIDRGHSSVARIEQATHAALEASFQNHHGEAPDSFEVDRLLREIGDLEAEFIFNKLSPVQAEAIEWRLIETIEELLISAPESGRLHMEKLVAAYRNVGLPQLARQAIEQQRALIEWKNDDEANAWRASFDQLLQHI